MSYLTLHFMEYGNPSALLWPAITSRYLVNIKEIFVICRPTMSFFKSFKGNHSNAHNDAHTSPPAREPTYQPPPGPPPSHSLHNPPPPSEIEYAPPPGPPPGWQKTPMEPSLAPPDPEEEPPPYQYVLHESLCPPLDRSSNFGACLGSCALKFCTLKQAILTPGIVIQ